MSLHQYVIDLSDYKGDEFDRVFDTLDRWSFTGLKLAKPPKVFTFFLEDDLDVHQIVNVPKDKIKKIR